MPFNLFAFDVSDDLPAWESILSDYGDSVGDSCLWSAAKESSELPHFGNLYQGLVINRLVRCLCNEFSIEEDSECLDVNFEINAIATYFNINGTAIQSKDDWISVRDKLEKQITFTVTGG